MPWVIRGERAYLYRSIRVDGRPKSIYVPVDQALARHQANTERRDAVRAARREAARDRSIVEAAQRALREAVAQELASAGYHLRKGQIRKTRGNTMQTSLVQSQELLPSLMHTEPAGALARRAVLLKVEGAEPQIRDEILAEFNRVLAEVGATATGPVEQLLVQEVALAWIELFGSAWGMPYCLQLKLAFEPGRSTVRN